MLQINRPRVRPIHGRTNSNRNNPSINQHVRKDMQHTNQNQTATQQNQSLLQGSEEQMLHNQSNTERKESAQPAEQAKVFTLTDDEVNMYAAMIFSPGANHACNVLNLLIQRAGAQPGNLFGSLPFTYVPPNIKLENLVGFVREYGELVGRNTHPFTVGYGPVPTIPTISEDVELAFLSIVETANKWTELQRSIADEYNTLYFKQGTQMNGGNHRHRGVRFGQQYGEVEGMAGLGNQAEVGVSVVDQNQQQL